MVRPIFSMTLALFFALGASELSRAAQPMAPPNCAGDLDASGLQTFSLVKVVADGQVHFQADAKGCPGAEPRCQRKAYALKGDVLIAAHQHDGWTCVELPNHAGGTQGWLRSNQIATLPVDQAPRVQDWSGKWERDRYASLEIAAKGPDLKITGLATWVGPNPGQVNDGELEGTGRPKGAYLTVRDAEGAACKAELRLLGPYLIVSDNGQCGGLNVSFSGEYRRISRAGG